MKKLFKSLVFSILATFAVSGCNGLSVNTDENGTQIINIDEDTINEKIHEIYNLYAVSEREEGKEPLSYEDWLELIKGEKGDQGEKGNDGTSLHAASGEPSNNLGIVGDSYIDLNSWDFYLKTENGWAKQGNIKGASGDHGNTIEIIRLKNSDGLVDTYEIILSDASSYTFQVINGSQGIQGIRGEKGDDGHTPVITIGNNGNWYIDGGDTGFLAEARPAPTVVDMQLTNTIENREYYTVYYSDGSNFTFYVINGTNGEMGIQGEKGDDGHTPVITISDEGYWVIDGVSTSKYALGLSPTIIDGWWYLGDQPLNVKASGDNGHTPNVYINNDGYWEVDGVSTGVFARGSQGLNGKDGSMIFSGTSTQYPNNARPGDLYFNTDSMHVYQYSENNSNDGYIFYYWNDLGSTKGADGTNITVGIDFPNNPKVGDICIIAGTWELYKYQSTPMDETYLYYWELQGTIKGEKATEQLHLPSFIAINSTIGDSSSPNKPRIIDLNTESDLEFSVRFGDEFGGEDYLYYCYQQFRVKVEGSDFVSVSNLEYGQPISEPGRYDSNSGSLTLHINNSIMTGETFSVTITSAYNSMATATMYYKVMRYEKPDTIEFPDEVKIYKEWEYNNYKEIFDFATSKNGVKEGINQKLNAKYLGEGNKSYSFSGSYQDSQYLKLYFDEVGVYPFRIYSVDYPDIYKDINVCICEKAGIENAEIVDSYTNGVGHNIYQDDSTLLYGEFGFVDVRFSNDNLDSTEKLFLSYNNTDTDNFKVVVDGQAIALGYVDCNYRYEYGQPIYDTASIAVTGVKKGQSTLKVLDMNDNVLISKTYTVVSSAPSQYNGISIDYNVAYEAEYSDPVTFISPFDNFADLIASFDVKIYSQSMNEEVYCYYIDSDGIHFTNTVHDNFNIELYRKSNHELYGQYSVFRPAAPAPELYVIDKDYVYEYGESISFNDDISNYNVSVFRVFDGGSESQIQNYYVNQNKIYIDSLSQSNYHIYISTAYWGKDFYVTQNLAKLSLATSAEVDGIIEFGTDLLYSQYSDKLHVWAEKYDAAEGYYVTYNCDYTILDGGIRFASLPAGSYYIHVDLLETATTLAFETVNVAELAPVSKNIKDLSINQTSEVDAVIQNIIYDSNNNISELVCYDGQVVFTVDYDDSHGVVDNGKYLQVGTTVNFTCVAINNHQILGVKNTAVINGSEFTITPISDSNKPIHDTPWSEISFLDVPKFIEDAKADSFIQESNNGYTYTINSIGSGILSGDVTVTKDNNNYYIEGDSFKCLLVGQQDLLTELDVGSINNIGASIYGVVGDYMAFNLLYVGEASNTPTPQESQYGYGLLLSDGTFIIGTQIENDEEGRSQYVISDVTFAAGDKFGIHSKLSSGSSTWTAPIEALSFNELMGQTYLTYYEDDLFYTVNKPFTGTFYLKLSSEKGDLLYVNLTDSNN